MYPQLHYSFQELIMCQELLFFNFNFFLTFTAVTFSKVLPAVLATPPHVCTSHL